LAVKKERRTGAHPLVYIITTVLLMIPPILVYLVSQSNVMETMSSAGMKD